ncbi:hypothetical protein, partial [Pseudoxanthomonas sp. KAs_5_3]|uniref:hypothetical protein n=1 Tax=Pseudoxanthomonas sp. KAs_5_3 TaxID=2067658 RepID=UPI0031BA421B
MTLGTGTTLDLTVAANQTVGSLAGLGGTVNLGTRTLTLGGLGNTSCAVNFTSGTAHVCTPGT